MAWEHAMLVIIIHTVVCDFSSKHEKGGKRQIRNNEWVLSEKVSENFHAISFGDGQQQDWKRTSNFF